MKAWLVYEKEGAGRNREYIRLYIEEGKKRGIDISLVLCEDGFPDELPDFCIVRAMRPDISEYLEGLGKRVFNNSHVSRICNNKARTYEYLHENNIPVIPWMSAHQADIPPEIAQYPVVIKPCCGHGGKNVTLIRNDEEYRAAREAIAPDEYVIQPLATESGRDMRVYIIGNRPVAAVLRTSEGDFRSNFSLGGRVCAKKLSGDEKALVSRVCELFDFDFCGIDIMYHEGRPVVNEIEDVVGSRMLYATHDIDIVSLYLDYITNEMKPE
ncbi:MAG: ATP-grasp domain-containing protein [Oscillospiraceae bacterium]|nr:ATP-grasp domain-containing protein [Oscillospiraceae bacterium]MBQ6901487.1 ATP-grasp domain-containing protein [Oscillospiraceae bacterium]